MFLEKSVEYQKLAEALVGRTAARATSAQAPRERGSVRDQFSEL